LGQNSVVVGFVPLLESYVLCVHIFDDCFLGLKMQEKDLEVDYEIGVVLGNGGFGTVYAGTRRRDGKRVRIALC